MDVTWKYSIKHSEVTRRRLLVREEWLSKTIAFFNQKASITEAKDQLEIKLILYGAINMYSLGKKPVVMLLIF